MKKTLLLLLVFFVVKSYPISQTKVDSINTKIKNQILILNRKNDSLSKRLDQIEKNDYKSIDIIEKVNDFYDKSWNKLIAFLSIAGSIILIVIPYIQIRNYKEQIDLKTKEFENLTNSKVLELELKITEFHREQFELLRKEITLSQEELNKNIKSETQYVQAFIFALRGMMSLKDKNYNMYFQQYINALNLFIGLNKNSAIKSMINSINGNIKKCIAKEISVSTNTKSQMDTLISTLEKDFYTIFPDIIDELKTESSKLIVN
ncbi:hypothetical protein [Flavobacterium sp. N502540]|uniref:hypothetical protein n=1 Tax=Flavobacterium sp. N502540 TaxID=2986838 RepID=UPI00222466DB|nr:hypothetical protein [Flavobacterium sp. N502540]